MPILAGWKMNNDFPCHWHFDETKSMLMVKVAPIFNDTYFICLPLEYYCL